jgi:hypothetical protein
MMIFSGTSGTKSAGLENNYEEKQGDYDTARMIHVNFELIRQF